LVEKAQEHFDEDEARRISKKIAKNQFNYTDFLTQINQIKKMGDIKNLAGMIPGMGKMMKDVEIGDEPFKGIEAIIGSMTIEERENPHLINGSRRKRIAEGSGNGIQEVNKMIKQFEEMRKMMKMMGDKKQMANMMAKMPGMGKT
jgi:signal recognition particle subunit SRP54